MQWSTTLLLFEFVEESEPLLPEHVTFGEEKPDHPLIYALKGLRPLKYEEWKDEGIIWKLLDILKV